MTIYIGIDDREQSRGKRAQEYYNTIEDYDAVITKLTYGDFVFTNTTKELTVAFEYKTLEDYISSIHDNRVFNQALNQSDNFDYHFVIVVGTDKQKQEIIKDKKQHTGNYMTNKQFYGTYASLVNVTSLIQVPTEKLAFMVMGQVAEKCLNDKPVVKRFRKSRGSPAFRLLNNNVNGIGFKTAELICDELDLVCIEDVFGLSVVDLVEIKGIGEKTAVSILEQLKREFN